LFKELGSTVTTAESCTAGGIAAAITDVAGSSAWFERGFITYSNASKIEEIDVAPAILQAFGAVSAQTVCQMALGAQKRAGADFALAVSGIAGPDGGTPDKPVGTVHFGLATPSGVFHRHIVFPFRSREQVRTSTIYSALALLLAWLEGDMGRIRVDGPFGQDQVFGPSGIEITEPE
jgi:PncC family amidohydrolase